MYGHTLNALVMTALKPTELGLDVNITCTLLPWSSVMARRCPAPPITCTVYIIQFQVSWCAPRCVSTSDTKIAHSVVRLTALARMLLLCRDMACSSRVWYSMSGYAEHVSRCSRAASPGTWKPSALLTAALMRSLSLSRHCAQLSTRSDIIRSTSTACVWMVLWARM